MIRKIIELIRVYQFTFIKIIYFEILYIAKGYKGNYYDSRTDKHRTDNIPCPYYFLSEISKTIEEQKIKSITDLGCGSGRALFFFSKKFKIKLKGIEFYLKSYRECKKIFLKNKKIKILNNDFLKINFNYLKSECYFINDPLKDYKLFKILLKKILDTNRKKKIYFILINIDRRKKLLFENYHLLQNRQFKSKIRNAGFYIYTNKS